MIRDWAVASKEERQATIAKYAAAGLSANQIALQFTGVTRNAIIGYCKRYDIKLHGALKRSGAVGRAVTSSPPLREPKREPVATTKDVKPGRPKMEIVSGEPIYRTAALASAALAPVSRSRAFEPLVGHVPVLLADIGPRQCHWPVNGLEGAEPIFCGASTSSVDATYCPHHSRLSQQR